MVNGCQPPGRNATHAFRQRLVAVVGHPIWGVRWRLAGEHPVRDRRQRIDVGRRSLRSLARVLLVRRISGRQHLCVSPLLRRHARGAEVDQHRLAVRRANHDVRRLDVPVQVVMVMHVRQAVEQPVEPRLPLIF